jgi:hypothetical protein
MDGIRVGDGKEGAKKTTTTYLLLWILKSLMTAAAAAACCFWSVHSTYRIPSGAQYVTLHIKIRWKKSQNIPVWLSKMVLARHFATGSLLRKLVDRKSVVIITIWLLLPVFDWSIIMIGRGGLLLPSNSWWSPTTYLQSQFSFSGVWSCRKREREKYVSRVTYIILNTSWDARKVH